MKNYKVVVFGVKDTSENIIDYIQTQLCQVDLVITVAKEVTGKNQISGYKGLSFITDRYGIPVYEAKSYGLADDETKAFFESNTFEIGIVMGWQRLIPAYVLDRFEYGIFGFHGNCGYLPFGRGRSPLNWSVILGDSRFNLNLFRYDEKADSPNVFATEMFSINAHDDIRTAQYKNMIASKRLIAKLIAAYKSGKVEIHTDSKDYDSWYQKRTPADGKIDWKDRTRNIYNLIRGVAAPFPGAFCYVNDDPNLKVTIWRAKPFDEMMDFSMYSPGEIVDVFDGKPIVRTVDGSIIIDEYECSTEIKIGDVLS